MKKIALLIAILLLFSFVTGCKDSSEKTNNTVFSYCENYFTLEEALFTYATDVVKARCIDVQDASIDYILSYQFQVIDRYLGEDVGETIYVYVPDYNVDVLYTSISYNTRDNEYEKNQDYYLILSRVLDVYTEHDYYRSVGANIYFPANDISQCSMFGDPITSHSNMSSCNTEQELRDYIVEYLKQNPNEDRPLYRGTKYITDQDMESVITQSDVVVKVQIEETDVSYTSSDRTKCSCTVVSVFKGENIEENTTIRINFSADTVSKGKKYIVALNQEGAPDFTLSSKNSLFRVSEEDEIMQYITP